MSGDPDPDCDSLALDFGGLTIRISRTPDHRGSADSASQSSFTVISPSTPVPRLGALASPGGGTADQAPV